MCIDFLKVEVDLALPEENICGKAKTVKPETDPDMVKSCEDCIQSWTKIIDGMLNVCTPVCSITGEIFSHAGNR